MSLLPSLAIYFVIWWLCLFVVLPFGVKSQHETGEVAPGTDAGAPHPALLLRRVLATTVLAAIIFAGVYLYFGVYGNDAGRSLPVKLYDDFSGLPEKKRARRLPCSETFAINRSSSKRLQRCLMKSSQDLDREYWCRGTFLVRGP